MSKRYRQSPEVTQPLTALKNTFIRGPRTLLRIVLFPYLWIGFSMWLFGVFMFYFLTGFFLSYIPARIYPFILGL